MQQDNLCIRLASITHIEYTKTCALFFSKTHTAKHIVKKNAENIFSKTGLVFLQNTYSNNDKNYSENSNVFRKGEDV